MSNVCDMEIAQETHQLGSVLRRIVDQIDDAERSNSDTLHEMQERLSSLSKQTSIAKENDTNVNKDDLEKIENKIAGLSNRIEVISQGRSINADDLEDRIEALADKLSVDDHAEDQGSSANTSNKEITEHISHSIDAADITFAVTEDMNDDAVDASSNDTVSLPVDISPGHINIPEIDKETVQKTHKTRTEHKIRASASDVTGPIAPQRLASLAEHFSPASNASIEENDSVATTGNEVFSEQKQTKHYSHDQGLEERFSIIARRLEETLASKENDFQERVNLSSKFDDLAAKFENWLSSSKSTNAVKSIEKKIDALTSHVQHAESYAARIETLEKSVLKLIDLVENRQQSHVSEEKFTKAFERIATQILEEKSSNLVDLVSARVGTFSGRASDTSRLKELERSITALSSERRAADVNQSRDIAKLSDSLEVVSGRLGEIEDKLLEQSLQEKEQDRLYQSDEKKELSRHELTKNENSDNDVPGIDVQDTGLSQGKEISLSLDDDEPEQEQEDDSFHTVLELSVNEALITEEHDIEEADASGFQVATEPPTLESFRNEKIPDAPPTPGSPEVQRSFSKTSSLDFENEKTSNDKLDDEFVEVARRAAEEAYEKKELQAYALEKENKAEQVIDTFIERKEQLVEKGKEFRKKVLGFRLPNSSAILFIFAAGLVVICFGILFKELFYAANSLAPRKVAGDVFHEQGRGGKNAALSERVVDNASSLQNAERIVPQLSAKDQAKTYSRGYQSSSSHAGQAERINSDDRKAIRNPVNRINSNGGSRAFSALKQNVAMPKDSISPANEGQRESAELKKMLQTNTNPAKRDYQIDMKPALARQQGYLQIGDEVSKVNGPKYIRKSEFDENSSKDGLVLPPEKIGSLSLRTAAASGNYKAQFAVAMRFIAGIRVKQNYPAAMRWLRRAASQSFAPAQYQLALLYEKGMGAEPDIGKAKTWYMRAARRGNMKAMHSLAMLYTKASATGTDFSEAIQWFRRAASYGYPDSLMTLGSFYKKGLGVKADKIEAYKWFSLAHSRGDIRAEKELNALKFNMSEDDIFHAEAAIAQWSQRAPNRASNLTEKEVAAFTGRIMPPFADALIYEAQLLLNKLGYDVGPADGQIGPKTRDAVRAFQMKNGLEATGQITPRFLSHLSRQAG